MSIENGFETQVERSLGLQFRSSMRSHPDYTALRHEWELSKGLPPADLLQARWACAFTNSETYFFRHHEQVQSISAQIRRRLQLQPSVQVWCAGCATGAEPFSLVLQLALEGLSTAEFDRLTIIGSDVNSQSLDLAKAGIYRDWALRSLSPSLLSNYFEKTDRGTRILLPWRAQVQFIWHNLVSTQPIGSQPTGDLSSTLGKFDIILCRNVLLHLHSVGRELVWQQLLQHLNHNGSIYIGITETGFHCSGMNLDPTLAHYFRTPEPATSCPPKDPPLPTGALTLRPLKLLDSTAEMEYSRALSAAARHDWNQAKHFLRRALYLDPHHRQAHLQLGIACSHLGNWKMAQKCLKNADGYPSNGPSAILRQKLERLLDAHQ